MRPAMMMRARIFSPAEVLAGVVQAAGELHPAKFGMHHDLDAIQRVAARIVVANVAGIRDDLPVVPFQRRVVVQHKAAGRGNQFAVTLDAQLPFGKQADLAFDLFPFPGLHAGEAESLHLDEFVEVVHRQLAKTNGPLVFLQINRFHSGRLVAKFADRSAQFGRRSSA
jgi:hypothetical protein